MAIFGRLMGLETEYAVRFRSAVSAQDRPSDYDLFQRLLVRLQEVLPTASAATDEPGRFLATGGAVRFERFRQAGKSGLVEGATPECRSPRELLAWQQAQDRLLSQAAARAGEPDGEFVLLKNNRDTQGQTYGSHENYEAVFATGLRLRLWRLGLRLLLPLLAVEWVLMFAVLVPLLVCFWVVASCVYFFANFRKLTAGRRSPAISDYLGEGLFNEDRHAMPWPAWFEPVVLGAMLLLLLPLIVTMSLLLRLTAFHRQRRRLLPFLATRTVFTGAGWLDARGELHLAQKVGRVNRVYGYYAVFDRPVLSFGHLLEAALLLPLLPHRYRRLFNERQRLQICVGDSNRCEEAEYLRVATTALVLEATEAGALPKVPHLWPPLRAMKKVSRDTTLCAPVATYRGRKLTALQVQRFYLLACRRFVAGRCDPGDEALDVLDRWEDVLDRLDEDRESLVGRVDWVTKKFLLDRAADLPADARKKIDLRYHEISPQGYFEQLQQTGLVRTLVDEEERDRAMRNAPSSTPAAVRGRYIREFADGGVALTVDWQQIQLGAGREAKKIDLT